MSESNHPQIRRQEAAQFVDIHATALGHIGQLVFTDLAHVEVHGLGVADVVAADAGRRGSWPGFRSGHADFVGGQRLEQIDLGRVVGAGGVAGRGANALVLLFA